MDLLLRFCIRILFVQLDESFVKVIRFHRDCVEPVTIVVYLIGADVVLLYKCFVRKKSQATSTKFVLKKLFSNTVS